MREAFTLDRLQGLWAELNLRYFRSVLPAIEIEWSRRLTASSGMFISRFGPRARAAGGERPPRNRRLIRLSRPLLESQPERDIIGTLAHEMIHQWQFDVLKKRPNHGSDFRDKMAAMNRDGLGITIRHDLDEAVRALARYAWRCLRCGRVYERHRRTIRPHVHRCGQCASRLKEIKPAHLVSREA